MTRVKSGILVSAALRHASANFIDCVLARRGDAEAVRIEARMAGAGNGDVLICALWGPDARCDEKSYRGGSNRRGTDRQQRVRIDRTHVGRQQVSFLDSQVRRQNDRQSRGFPKRLVQLIR